MWFWVCWEALCFHPLIVVKIQQPQQPEHVLTSPPQSRAQPLSSDCSSDEPVAVLRVSPGASASPSSRAVIDFDLHCEFVQCL